MYKRQHQDRIRSQTPKKAFKRALEERKVVRLSVAKACHLVGISRQAYYQRLTAETNQTNQHQTILQLVREQRMVQPRVGTRKLHYMLKVPMAEHRIKMGRDALFNLLRPVSYTHLDVYKRQRLRWWASLSAGCTGEAAPCGTQSHSTCSSTC